MTRSDSYTTLTDAAVLAVESLEILPGGRDPVSDQEALFWTRTADPLRAMAGIENPIEQTEAS